VKMNTYREEVLGFVDKGNYHAAINVALSGMNQCRKEHDQKGVDQCLHIIEDVIRQLVQEYGSKEYPENG
jgi:hypothetical protein